MKSGSLVLMSVEDCVARIALNRPDRLNAFTVAMHEELRQALERCAQDEAVRCLVITGEGRGFCAGQDLSDPAVRPDQPDATGDVIARYYNPLSLWLATARMPVIAAVNGVAAGAGANLALNCDVVIAAQSAKFVQSFAKLGLVPDTGGSWLLPRLTGRARALGMALLGEPVTAAQALEWGMIWKVVEDAALEQTVMSLARHLATQPTAGLARIRKAIDAASTQDLPRQLALEHALQMEAGRSEDYAEGVRAFLEKRPPRYSGR